MHRLFASAFLLALIAAPTVAGAWCRTTSVTQDDPLRCVSGGQPLAWSVRCVSLSLNVGALPAGTSAAQARQMLGSALDAWGATRCASQRVSVDLSLGADTTARAEYVLSGPNLNAVVFRRDWNAAGLPPSALALTTLTFGATSGEIRDADVQVNLSMPLSAATPTLGNDLPTILLHEVGHVLGLDHSDDRGAVMYYAAGRGEQRRSLTADDQAGLCVVHPPSLQRPCAPPSTAEGCACACPAPPVRAAGAWPLALAALLLRARRRGARG